MFDAMRKSLLVCALLLAMVAMAGINSCCCTGGLDDDELPIYTPETQLIPPVAVVTATPSAVVDSLEVSFDATASYDTDGTIEQYDWDFDSDGTYDLLDGGATPIYTYEEAGTYMATVRVIDNDDLTDTAPTASFTIPVTVSPPEAIGSATPDPSNPTRASFDASDSFDTDGTIVQYDWDMDNDGTFELIDGGPTPSHDFSAYGTFTVGVRVTDNDGLTDTTTISVTLIEPDPDPVAPVAALIPDPAHGDTDLVVDWDASGSTDADGTIEQYDWDMDNDGTYEITDGGATQTATYTAGGVYTVGVQVTDNDLLTDSTTASVDVNEPPVADLVGSEAGGGGAGKTVSISSSGIDVLWDATGSTDSDGTIEHYDWDMDNDGTFELLDSTATQTVTVPAYGTYTVGVRVTDDDGAQDQTTADLTLIGTPPVADLTADAGSSQYSVSWIASGSTDADGTIVLYEWDFDNDGTYDDSGVAATIDHDYGTWGLKTCTVRVTDDDGMMDTDTAAYTILEPPNADLAGTAGWQPTMPYNPYVDWDASASTDADGTIVLYEWDVDNDGTYDLDTGNVPTHQAVYSPSDNSATCTVRVTDNDGLTDTATLTAPFSTQQYPPMAALTGEDIGDWTVHWDASGSIDLDGTIVLYEYDFEDDGIFDVSSATETSQWFTYPSLGGWTCRLRVTDNDGLTDETTYMVVVGAPE